MDIDGALQTANQQAKLLLALKCKKDLFFLARYVLGYELMTPDTHQELASYVQGIWNRSTDQPVTPDNQQITPHSPQNPQNNRIPLGNVVNPSPDRAPKILEGLGVHGELPTTDSESLLYQPGISDTQNDLDVHQASRRSSDPDKKQLLILMPRGTFKSSVVTVAFTLQTILNDPDTRVLIDSETFAKAKAFFAEVKGHLEGNQAFIEIYKTLYASEPSSKKRDELWSDSQLNISARKRARKEPTISCGGVDVTKNGMHYDLIIMDDLHSELNTANEDQIEKVIQHYKLAYSLLDPGCPLIVIGTRWTYYDLYQYILDNEADNFNILVKKAHNPDGSLFFPSRLTEEFLQKTRRTQGSYLYSCQYENEPVDDETATFKRSNLIRKPYELVRDMPMNWYLSVDPSYEGPYSDYAALVVAGMNHQKDIYVRHVLRQKMNYSQIIDAIFELYNRYEPKTVLLETIAAQKSIQYELNNEQRRRGTWLPVTEIRSRTKSKEERIRALAPFYEFGHIFHIKECPQLDELENELIHFPKGQHDDCIDALASILEVAKPAGHSDRQAKRERNRELYDVLTKPRSPLTGV